MKRPFQNFKMASPGSYVTHQYDPISAVRDPKSVEWNSAKIP